MKCHNSVLNTKCPVTLEAWGSHINTTLGRISLKNNLAALIVLYTYVIPNNPNYT